MLATLIAILILGPAEVADAPGYGPRPEVPFRGAGLEECEVYRAFFPGSAFRSHDGRYRLQPFEDGSDIDLREARRLQKRIIRRTGGAASPWSRIDPDRFAAAFASWRAGDLAACDWPSMAYAVAPAAMQGDNPQPVIVAPDSTADTAFTRVFFLNETTALVLLREYYPYRAGFTRRLVLAFREPGGSWGVMHPEVIEERCFPC